MSDTMLLGILRMPLPNNPDPLTLAQFAWRAGQAADRIEHDAAEIKRLRAENETLRADLARISEEMGLPPTVGPAPGVLKRIVAWANDAGPLRAFARDVMAEWPDDGIECDDLATLAITHHLLVPVTRTTPCGDECACVGCYSPPEMDAGITCYRRGPLLRPQGTADDAGPAEEIERLQAAQFAGKVRKAADPIDRGEAEMERLRTENETLRAASANTHPLQTWPPPGTSPPYMKFLAQGETWEFVDDQLFSLVDLFRKKAARARSAAKRYRARGDLVRWRKACAVARVWEMARDRVAKIGFFPF